MASSCFLFFLSMVSSFVAIFLRKDTHFFENAMTKDVSRCDNSFKTFVYFGESSYICGLKDKPKLIEYEEICLCNRRIGGFSEH